MTELVNNGKETVSLKEIEGFLGVAQPTAAGIVKRMEKNLVSSYQAADDRRVKMIRITEEGRQKAAYGCNRRKAFVAAL